MVTSYRMNKWRMQCICTRLTVEYTPLAVPDASSPRQSDLIILTGATGYVGGRLAPRLLEAGYRVRCLTRNRRKALARPWASHPNLEVVECDIADVGCTAESLRGAAAAYYLVHSMVSAGGSYAERDRNLASAFAEAAARADLPRIIYLGGLGELGDDLSEHLRSRREVEQTLATGSAEVTVLRAAMIIGSGSASFEILRYLVERLPIMITPKWVNTRCQPIAIRNVLHYLVACLQKPETIGATLDIGGPDVESYTRIMRIMAEERELPRRLVIPVPVLTPKLSSLWIHLVTPISAKLARPLAEGLKNEVVCRDDRAAELMPQRLLTIRESIDAALGKTDRAEIESSWSDAGVVPGDPEWAGGTVFEDTREEPVEASAEATFRAICRLGGGHGYYAVNWLWRIRGWMDKLIGGPGLRRGRRDPSNISYGDALDFWRVIGVEENESLDLLAEMKLPGQAMLSFDITPDAADPSLVTLKQTARFKPRGLVGLLYWYSVLPMHYFVFRGMLSGIRREAERVALSATTS